MMHVIQPSSTGAFQARCTIDATRENDRESCEKPTAFASLPDYDDSPEDREILKPQPLAELFASMCA